MKAIFKIGLFTLVCTSLWGCYRMPTDEDCCMIPLTNNKDFTKEKAQIVPGMSY